MPFFTQAARKFNYTVLWRRIRVNFVKFPASCFLKKTAAQARKMSYLTHYLELITKENKNAVAI